MAGLSGLGTALAAAAPGAFQGISNAVGSYQDYQKDKALDASVGQQTGVGPVGTADANHPIWGILNNLTGNPGNAPLPGGGAPAQPSPIPAPQMMDSSQFPAAQMGAAIPPSQAPQQLQNGGVVRANYGRRTIAPSFERGPALPTGPNNTVTGPTSPTMQGMAGYEDGGVVRDSDGQSVIHKSTTGELIVQGVKELGHAIFGDGAAARAGDKVADRPATVNKAVDGYAHGGLVGDTAMGQGITPASTEGQILSFDAGGVVPDGFHEQQGISGVPMSGRGAALVEGIQAGQNIGHNLQQAWHDNRARSAAADYAGSVAGVDVNNPNSGSTPTSEDWLGKAKDAVEGFFHHMNNVSLDDNHKPNGAQAIPAPAAVAPGGVSAPGGSPVPSNPPGEAPGVGAPPNGGAAAPTAPAAPSPIPAPAGAASGAPPTQPGAGPAQPPGAGPNGQAPVAGGTPQQPNVQQQATQVATKSVAANQEVQQGVPDKTPEQSELPHSMTPAQWQHMNLLKQKAVMAAARAGEDPAKVYESLTAMQNAHFQGQILKQLGTANVAFQNGDMKSVEQALKNVNYYLPNGQDIQFKKAAAQDAATDPTVKPGDLMYRNPFFGMYGHEKDPEYTKIDSQHIQSLGAAALNPQTVQEAQLKSYSAQQEAQSNRIKAQGEFMTGQGRQLTGAASYGKMNLAQQSQDVDRRLKIAAGNKDQAEANWYNTRQPGGSNTGQPKITLASLRSLQNDAATYTDRIVQGQPTTSPVMVSDGAGGTTPNLSPGAGRAIPDASRIPAWATNGVDKNGKPVPLTPEQQENVKVLGGQINSANAGLPGMNTPKAVELAARITHYQSHPTTHTDPATGKPAKDFVYDRYNGTAHVWVGNAYENVYLKPNVADESGAGGGPEAPPPGGNSAPNSGGENEGPDAFQ
jgi:hypothetical protein